VILVHNHPSGDIQPSEADRRTHDQLSDAAKILGLRVLDNIIVTRKGYFSFQETRLL
jgi:DNA repair protein RadC